MGIKHRLLENCARHPSPASSLCATEGTCATLTSGEFSTEIAKDSLELDKLSYLTPSDEMILLKALYVMRKVQHSKKMIDESDFQKYNQEDTTFLKELKPHLSLEGNPMAAAFIELGVLRYEVGLQKRADTYYMKGTVLTCMSSICDTLQAKMSMGVESFRLRVHPKTCKKLRDAPLS